MRPLVLCLGWLAACGAAAQELTPRAYWPAPVGTQIMTVGTVYTDGDLIPDPTLPLTGVDSDIYVYFLAYRRTTGWFGRTTNLIVEVPYADGETRVSIDLEDDGGDEVRRRYSGIGDLSATLSVNLLGAPAMDRAGFAALRQDPRPILGISAKLTAPTGDYDDNRILNVGANRWAGRLELGYIQPLSRKWLFELQAGATFFQDNDDFVGFTREQDPIYGVEFHLVHRFAPGFWASLDLNGYRGGRSTVDGGRLDDLQRDSMVGATLAFPFMRRYALKLSYSTGSTVDSDQHFDAFQVAFSWAF